MHLLGHQNNICSSHGAGWQADEEEEEEQQEEDVHTHSLLGSRQGHSCRLSAFLGKPEKD